MIGNNNLYILCGIIELIARKTKNKRKTVINIINRDGLYNIWDSIYDCKNIDKSTNKLIEKFNITIGGFDNITDCIYDVPNYFDIGKVYGRLIIQISIERKENLIDTLMEVYNSWISDELDDYNSNMYQESPSYIYYSYLEGYPLE